MRRHNCDPISTVAYAKNTPVASRLGKHGAGGVHDTKPLDSKRAFSARIPIFAIRFKEIAAVPLAVAVAYFAGAEAAFLIGTLSDKIFAPFWPPNVILFCALLRAPERHWWLYIVATFPAHALAELQVGMPAAQLLVAFA